MTGASARPVAAATSAASAFSNKDAVLRRAQILLEVSQRCAETSSLDGVLGELVGLTSRELDCDRGTLFLHDETTGELYSRIAQGDLIREIRILKTSGIAGRAFSTGESIISDDPYSDPSFNKEVDEATGYRTRNILCVPIRTRRGAIIGVMQCLNKNVGTFTAEDIDLLSEMTCQAAVVISSLQYIERIDSVRTKETEFLDLISDLNSEVDMSRLLERSVAEITQMLGAERATIFLHDEATQTLFSRVTAGGDLTEIRIPSHAGIAGSVFTSGQSLNIPYAYADLRFNPAVDRQTGFFTRSILCVPIVNKEHRTIGVTQVLNRIGGTFTDEDGQRLKAFTAQIAIAFENSKLFDDVQRMKNYNEAMLQSMSNGVITLDAAATIVTCNAAGGAILEKPESEFLGKPLADLLGEDSRWILDRIEGVRRTAASEVFPDANIRLAGVEKSLNLTIMPLTATEGDKDLGSMLMFEDISNEKRMKSTMSRYMDPIVATRMLEGGTLDLLGGANAEATIMFTDIRGFTTITEEYGPQGTVSFLNDYFTRMVECITREGGMLDKFIGDAIMACFGLPIAQDDDADRAARAALAMIRALWEWNAERRAHGLKTVDMGVGLNTDMVVSGNIGSPKRMDYTVIGDGVNLASRLESACKTYSARILASEATVAKLRGTYRMRDIDLVVVKGKTRPVRVFELLDYHDAESFPNLMDLTGYFAEGMTAYRAGDWARASARFETCRKLNPQDALSATYMERCRILEQSPPQGEWDGVWVMAEK